MAALVLGALALPLVGFVLGPVAIGCGILALRALQVRADLKGTGLAVAGVVLGSIALVGWVGGVAYVLGRPSAGEDSPGPAAAGIWSSRAVGGVEDAEPHVRRALRANVVLRCQGSDEAGLGSAVVVRREAGAYVALTNRHVVSCGDGRALTAATLQDVEQRPAKVCWMGPEGLDVAVVRVEARGAPEPVPVRAAGLPHVGEGVFAVGNPLGYEASFTTGVLSAVRQGRGARILQVQASINPGNSGGGLYDVQGRLVGLNTWTAGRGVAEGMGFAIAAADVAALLREAGSPCGAPLDLRDEEAR
ncbi:MAG: trypsin-like peptidase domain-containing protein [Anaeromyxobacter sp.]